MTPMSKVRELADAADAAASELAQAMNDHYHEQASHWRLSVAGEIFDELISDAQSASRKLSRIARMVAI